MISIEDIKAQTNEIVKELITKSKIRPGEILVVGCSTSEVAGERIGSSSSEELGKLLFDQIKGLCNEYGIFLGTQCCEHLNRAVIVEEECAFRYGLTRVNVVPRIKAGGSFSTAAYNGFKSPVAVESLNNKAAAGIDIGDTLIGMHLRPVAVPLRTGLDSIGEAHVVCARTRPKYIGGERASYDPELS